MPNTYACKGVSNPNVPMFPPRVCTLVLFIIIVLIQSPKREPLVSNIIIILGETKLPHSLAKTDCYVRSNSPDNCR